MKLTDFLELEERALARERRLAVGYCEDSWFDFMDDHDGAISVESFMLWFSSLLYECERARLEYPCEFSMRLQQLQDGQWLPPVERLETWRELAERRDRIKRRLAELERRMEAACSKEAARSVGKEHVH
jgi:hypothetical protein